MAEPLLCLLARCAVPGRHRERCNDEQCRGCQPARARDGGRLCELHTLRIGQDAARLAELYDELALRLLGGSGHGEPVSGTPDDTRVPSEPATDMRREIRHTLMSWTQLIAEERGVHLPDGSAPARPVKAMSDTPIWRGQGTVEQAIAGPPQVSVDQAAAFVAKHAEWLAATEYADEVADELYDLVRRARQVAYPSGTRRIPVPLPDGGTAHCLVDGCPGVVWALLRPGDLLELGSWLVCDADDTHRWGPSQWHAYGRAVKARAA